MRPVVRSVSAFCDEIALNAVFQVLTYAALGVFYLNVLPGWLGLHAQNLAVSMGLCPACNSCWT